MKNKPRIFTVKQNCSEYYIIHPSCQTVSPISVFYINTKNIDGVLILLKFIWGYAYEKF